MTVSGTTEPIIQGKLRKRYPTSWHRLTNQALRPQSMEPQAWQRSITSFPRGYHVSATPATPTRPTMTPTNIPMDLSTPPPSPKPAIFNYVLAVILVSLAWGFTTPFIRRGAVNFHPPKHPSLERIPTDSKREWVKYRILKAGWTVLDLLKTPAYAIPLVINLTGSVWFFLLVGSSGE